MLDQAAALDEGMRQIEGLHFMESPIFESPLEIYKAFISHAGTVPQDRIPATLATSLFRLLEICIQFMEVWERDFTRAGLYSLIQIFWDSPHVPHVPDIRNVLTCIHDARLAYRAKYPNALYPADDMVCSVIGLIDHMAWYIKTHDYDGRDHLTFPHAFGSFDLSVLGEPQVRSMVFPNRERSNTIANDISNYYTTLDKGANPINPFLLKDEYKLDQYPTKQSDPLNTRAYLCRLALATGIPQKRLPLFLAPIAFITHDERRSWDLVTKRLSRYYATIEEFQNYFRRFATRIRESCQHHVLALATPWFYSIRTASHMTIKDAAPIWETWEKKCHRAGLIFILSSLDTRPGVRSSEIRLLIFQPATGEPMADAQEAWIADMINSIKSSYNLKEIWVNGCFKRSGKIPSRKRKASGKEEVPIDPVVTSAQFLEQVMILALKIPEDHDELRANQFERIDDQEVEVKEA